MSACVDNGDNTMLLDLTFVGNGEGRLEVLINSVDGEQQQQIVECGESCQVEVDQDAVLQLLAYASPGSNFLSWNRNGLQKTCRGTGICEFFLYDDYELEADFSSTQAVLEIEHTRPMNLPITYAGTNVVYEGRTGDGVCNSDKCVIIADVGTELQLSASPGSERVRWSEIGSCGPLDLVCVVGLAEGPNLTIRLERNKWLGVSLADEETQTLGGPDYKNGEALQ